MLYIVATPIGNLEDITLRALRVLKEMDLILCEDTRVTKKLLDHFEIKTPTLSYHQHSKFQKINYILNLLREGKNLALVTDAGTPGISDPGGELVREVIKELGVDFEIVPVPGASAITTLLSASGLPADKFIFLGFLPHKKGRETIFKEILESDKTVVFYESVHRIIKTLNRLREIKNLIKCDDNHILLNTKYSGVKGEANFHGEGMTRKRERQVVVGRELTKKFETIYRGTVEEILEKIEKDKVKGEFVVIIK